MLYIIIIRYRRINRTDARVHVLDLYTYLFIISVNKFIVNRYLININFANSVTLNGTCMVSQCDHKIII